MFPVFHCPLRTYWIWEALSGKATKTIPSFDSALNNRGASFVSSIFEAFLAVISLSTFSLSKADPGSSPLEAAAQEGHTEVVEKLIKAGAIVNYQNKVWECLAVILLCVPQNTVEMYALNFLMRNGAINKDAYWVA